MLKIGQYFTEDASLQDKVASLCTNEGSCLEPSAGVGHLVRGLEKTRHPIIALELDTTLTSICNTYISNIDFFDYPIINKFNTVFGNPPFLKIREVPEVIKQKAFNNSILSNCNLFYYFIEKSFHHLNNGGELIFIIPREFTNSTRARSLRELLYNNGTITDLVDYKEEKLFKDASPSIIIIRYEKDNFSHKTNYCVDGNAVALNETLHNGSYIFSTKAGTKTLSEYFDIKVGLVTGLNKVFERKSKLSIATICSDYKTTKEKRHFVFADEYSLDEIKNKDVYLYEYLFKHKDVLKARKIKKFTEQNWYKYGAVRNLQEMRQEGKCIYVNAKTRVSDPFYVDDISYYDGSVLALYPKGGNIDLNWWCNKLNNSTTDFEEQNLYVNNKHIFTVKTLSDFLIRE